MKAKPLILSRHLPKTGQETAYHSGDDGYYELGWWRGRSVANNRTRFVAKTIGGDDVVIDLATGLMWAADGNAAGCNDGNSISFTDAFTYFINLDFAGFEYWRVPNIFELLSLVDFSEYDPAINTTFFPNTASMPYWSSTTYINDTDKGFFVYFLSGYSFQGTKIIVSNVRGVRDGA